MARASDMVSVLMAKNIAEAWMAWSLKAARNWAMSIPRNVREWRWSAGWKVFIGPSCAGAVIPAGVAKSVVYRRASRLPAPPAGGRIWSHVRRHVDPGRHRGGRPGRRGAALAAGLRRAAQTGGGAAGAGTAGADAGCDGAGARGVPPPGGRRAGAAVEQPGTLLRRGRRGH